MDAGALGQPGQRMLDTVAVGLRQCLSLQRQNLDIGKHRRRGRCGQPLAGLITADVLTDPLAGRLVGKRRTVVPAQHFQPRQTFEEHAQVALDDVGPTVLGCRLFAQGLDQIPLQVQPEMVDALGECPLDLIEQFAPALLQIQAFELCPGLASGR
ncbi:hypothetical protein D3C81_1130260 [compost metagenome]